MSVITEAKFFINTIKESYAHPRSTSILDKKTGKVVGRIDNRGEHSEQPKPEDSPKPPTDIVKNGK